MAFAGPIVAFSSTRENENAFAALNRFAIVPMFLFSGTFFPVSQLPEVLRWIAHATPLWHGVELVRSLTLGHVGVSDLLHVAYLAVWAAAGIAFAARQFQRKLGV
jgi:lipooligosaccharide transport system permease protein